MRNRMSLPAVPPQLRPSPCWRRRRCRHASNNARACTRKNCVRLNFRDRLAGRVKERLTRRRGSAGLDRREAVAQPRHPAGIVSRQAGPAHLGPHRIDRACGRDPDLAEERHAAIAVAAHAPQRIVHQRDRDAIEVGIGLGGEARPLPGIGAARPTALAERRIVRRQVGGADRKLQFQAAARGVWFAARYAFARPSRSCWQGRRSASTRPRARIIVLIARIDLRPGCAGALFRR
jgi:hypothetical protein